MPGHPALGGWLLRSPTDTDRLRLFCLPYAGGSAGAYLPWAAMAGQTLTVCPLEPPGRGTRFHEPLILDPDTMVERMADAVEHHAWDRPYVLFGHSLGGLMAFELTRALRRRGLPLPAHLFISATMAPSVRRADVWDDACTDGTLLSRLAAYQGTPREVLEDTQLMALLLPVIRADFGVLARYRYWQELPLPVAITVLAGRNDPHTHAAGIEAWQAQTELPLELQWFEGDHFFLRPLARDVLSAIMTRTGIRLGK